MPETLARRLDAFRAEWERKAPPARRAAFERQIEAAGAETRALGVGDTVPDLALPEARSGRPVALRDLLPAVILFYRGGWCPYCALVLRAWQERLGEVAAAGGRLVAISPQDLEHSLSTQEGNDLGFTLLSDTGGAAARGFGLEHEVPEALRSFHEAIGHALPEIGAGTGWRLPVPATFVAGAGGRIALAHADPDYRRRLEPSAALAALRQMMAGSTAA